MVEDDCWACCKGFQIGVLIFLPKEEFWRQSIMKTFRDDTHISLSLFVEAIFFGSVKKSGVESMR